MPSLKKIMHFFSSALLSIGGVAILGYAMSADWVQSIMPCSPEVGAEASGSDTIKMGLFNGSELKVACPRFDHNPESVPVFAELGTVGGAAIVLHVLVLVLLVLALVGSAGSILITLFNTVSNPYETYMGPIGLFVCSGLSASLAFLAMLLYLTNMFAVKIAQKLAKLDPSVVITEGETLTFLVGFYLLLPYIAVSLLSILVVYLYVHAAYTQRQEQEKPTEDAPKDIMMY